MMRKIVWVLWAAWWLAAAQGADSVQYTRTGLNLPNNKAVSVDFQNVDVRTILQVLAQESGLNLVVADNVQGKMTLSLHKVPLQQMFQTVLDAKNLDFRRHGNIVHIAPREALLERDKKSLQIEQDIAALGVLQSQRFQLKYRNVDELKDMLSLFETSSSANGKESRHRNSILSPRGSALIDSATNTLIINDTPAVLEKIAQLIQQLDVPAKQVMVEARIVEAADGVSQALGVKFGFSRQGGTSAGATLGGAADGIFEPNVNLPAAAAVNSIALVRALSSGALGLELSAMEQDSRSKTISHPRILTQDRKEAEIKQGFQVPYQTRGKDGEYSTAFKDAALSLKVTPHVTPDNHVVLMVAINKDDVERSLSNIDGEPAISTKQIRTQAMIENGGTLVIGGVYQETSANIVRKVPLLGDIPILGELFKSRQRDQNRNELLFFITPKIVDNEWTKMPPQTFGLAQ